MCLLTALAKLVLELPLLSRYGWHGDELYFRAAGQHLALGYVDYPPLTPALARAVEVMTGPSLFSRLALSPLGVVAAVAAGAIARELGAGAHLQVAATVVWIATPFALGGATTPFNLTFLELAATALAMLAATRLLVRNEFRQWLLLGLWAGIGLESKYTSSSRWRPSSSAARSGAVTCCCAAKPPTDRPSQRRCSSRTSSGR